MEFKGTIRSLTQDLQGNYLCTVEVPRSHIEHIQKIKDKVLNITFRVFKKKRSLNANNYAWHLITEISNVIGVSKEAFYEDMLRHYGQRTTIRLNADIDLKAYGIKYYELIDQIDYFGEMVQADYFVYKGSSEMDSKEMSILIDGIVQEAKQLNIPTKSDEELDGLLKNWEVEHVEEKPSR